MNEEVSVRGQTLKIFKDYVIETFGKEKFETILDRMKPENSKIMGSTLLSGEWYPVMTLQDYLNGFEAIIGRKHMRDFSIYLCESQIRGLFGLVAKFFSYERLLAIGSKLFDKFYRGAHAEIDKIDEYEVIIKFEGMDMPESQIFGLLYYIEHLIFLTSKRKVIGRPKKEDSNTVRLFYTFI